MQTPMGSGHRRCVPQPAGTAMAETRRIHQGSRVRMHFALTLAEGTEAVSTFGEAPLELVMGDGTLLPALESSLHGLAAGTRQTFLLTPEHAYGPRDEGLVHRMPLGDFARPPERGQIIAFSLPHGEEMPGTVLAVDGDTVEVDFNHPLAGRNLVFRVEILEVQDPGGPTP